GKRRESAAERSAAQGLYPPPQLRNACLIGIHPDGSAARVASAAKSLSSFAAIAASICRPEKATVAIASEGSESKPALSRLRTSTKVKLMRRAQAVADTRSFRKL